MKKIIPVFMFLSLFQSSFAQDTSRNVQVRIYRALTLYPFEKQLGYRSNLTRKWFSDFKGGMTFSALPFFVLELNRNFRYVNRDKIKVYSGVGITLDSYVPGIQVPLGIELVPLAGLQQLTIIVEVKPKISLGPTNFVNISLSPHLGLAYYFKQKTEAIK